jgi:hypothetical protein
VVCGDVPVPVPVEASGADWIRGDRYRTTKRDQIRVERAYA